MCISTCVYSTPSAQQQHPQLKLASVHVFSKSPSFGTSVPFLCRTVGARSRFELMKVSLPFSPPQIAYRIDLPGKVLNSAFLQRLMALHSRCMCPNAVAMCFVSELVDLLRLEYVGNCFVVFITSRLVHHSNFSPPVT